MICNVFVFVSDTVWQALRMVMEVTEGVQGMNVHLEPFPSKRSPLEY